jgi:MoaA/NifB/PqqE/SkfB family radical SAM enzyme
MKKFKNIYVEITRACNLKCSFCPSKDYTSKDFIEESKFKYIIDEIKD